MTKEEFKEEMEQFNERVEELEKEKERVIGERRYVVRKAMEEGIINQQGQFIDNSKDVEFEKVEEDIEG